MRYLFLFLALMGCAVRADDKPVEKKLTYTEQVAAFQATVAGMSATLGNNTSELEGVKEELRAVKGELKEVRDLLTLPTVPAVPVPVPPSEPAPVKADAPLKDSDRRITFQGKPIDVDAWLRRSVTTVEIVGDVDKHLRDHGLDGDFSGLTRDQKIKLHSCAHASGVPLKSSKPVVMNAAVVWPQASNCPNGNCSRYGTLPRRWGFGRLR